MKFRTEDIVSLSEKPKSEIKVLPREALFGFVAWLTTREVPVSFGADNDCSVACSLTSEFCKVNNYEKVRDEFYPDNIVFPKNREERFQSTLLNLINAAENMLCNIPNYHHGQTCENLKRVVEESKKELNRND